MSSVPWPSKAETPPASANLVSYTISPPIFADLVLDLEDFRVILDVERQGWLEKASELQEQAKRAGLVMRDTGEVAAWLDTDGQPFECFSRVTGRISLGGHTQERRAFIKCGDVEIWIDSDGQEGRDS